MKIVVNLLLRTESEVKHKMNICDAGHICLIPLFRSFF